jgi:hypothetical protein
MSSCPTPETLSRLAGDSASGSHFATMEAHVQSCANCQDVLERMAADTSVSLERASGRLAEPEHPPTIPGFVIEGVIGRGGMAVVYQAWQPQLARRVAIKVVSASALIGAEDRIRWLREAQAIGRVRHPNVVQLHQAGEQDGCLYLVLDLIAGGSLADRVTGPLPARVAVELMTTVARAVDQIRRAGSLDDARHTAACLTAFAKALLRRDPDEAAFHLVRAEAFAQDSKNARRIPEHAAIVEDGLRKALGEACTALRLDPRNADARLQVAILEDKLVALVSEPFIAVRQRLSQTAAN